MNFRFFNLFLTNHRHPSPCLAVLQKPKRARKSPEQLENHEKMMAELYKACQGMKKRVILDDDVDSDERLFFILRPKYGFWHKDVKIIFSESDSGIVEVSLKRKIPTSFSCSNVDGTQCRKEWNFFCIKIREFFIFL